MDNFSNAPPVADRLAIDYEDLRAEISAALEATGSIEIESDDDMLLAREFVAPLKALQGKIDAAHKREKAPFLDGGRQVDGYFKALRVAVDATVAAFTAQASAYQAKKLALAREQAASEARIAAMLEEPTPAAPAPAAATRVADNGTVAVSGSVRWDFEVVDIGAVPRELLQINAGAVKAKVAGLKATTTIDKAAGAIPGLRIVERISTTFR